MANETKKLPPDPDGGNPRRAAWAGIALKAFGDIPGADPDAALGDLLVNLRHWCDRNDEDFDDAVRRSLDHYEAETQELDDADG